MGDHGPTRLGQQFPEGLGFWKGNRIDNRKMVPRRHLDQAELRTVGVLGDKFRIKRDHGLCSDFIAESPEVIDRVYRLVLQR